MCSLYYSGLSICYLVPESYLTLAAPWIVTFEAPLSLGFPRQEYWSGLPFPSPGDLPDPGIEPKSVSWQADSLLLSHQGSTVSPLLCHFGLDNGNDTSVVS